ncbi:hypothetical protein Vi05172_g23 [Venturia inaequalis]|nr:hypothetical protein Vi05172_g23 [Venturia inaequalis]
MVADEAQDANDSYLNRRPMYSLDRFKADRDIAHYLHRDTHPDLLKNECRLTRRQFISLAQWLDENTELTGSKYANLNTKLCIFLHLCGHRGSFRDTANRYWVPYSQIHKYFYEVLAALLLLA